MSYKIAIIDDEVSICEMLKYFFEKRGYEVDTYNSGVEFLDIFKKEPKKYSLVILDLMLPRENGLDILQKIKQKNQDLNVIIITAYGTIENVKEALKLGAFDFIEKPFDMEIFASVVDKAIIKEEKNRNYKKIKRDIEETLTEEDIERSLIIGKNEKILEAIETAIKVAKSDITILITGESGTGKELIANLIYKNSNRKDKPFLKVNCAALPETLLESEFFGHVKGAFTGAIKDREGLVKVAYGGTLFLDEISSTSLNFQSKLLRFIQYKEYSPVGDSNVYTSDVRIIAATNEDLKQLVREGRFREDLYYRLNVVNIYLPPLRERLDDLEDLVNYFLKKYAKKYNKEEKIISKDVWKILYSYYWPGNIRELENLIERFYIISDKEVKAEDLPIEILESTGVRKSNKNLKLPSWQEIEKAYIYYVLSSTGWNKSEASRILGIDPATLYRKLSKYNFNKDDISKEEFLSLRANLQFVEKAILFYFIKEKHLNLTEISEIMGIDIHILKEKLKAYEIL